MNIPFNHFDTDSNIETHQNIISDDDLEMVARIFYMRKQELERVSYLDAVEDETLFYDCHTETKHIQEKINDIKIPLPSISNVAKKISFKKILHTMILTTMKTVFNGGIDHIVL